MSNKLFHGRAKWFPLGQNPFAPPLVTGLEIPRAETAVKPNSRSRGRVFPRWWVLVSEMKQVAYGVHSVVRPLGLPCVIRPARRASDVVMIWLAVVWRVQMGVSIWDTVHSHSVDRWALNGADVQGPRHGVLKTVWLLCNVAHQVGCLRGWGGVPLV